MAAVAGLASRSSILLAQRPEGGPGGEEGGASLLIIRLMRIGLQGPKSGVSLFRGLFKSGILNWRRELQEGGAYEHHGRGYANLTQKHSPLPFRPRVGTSEPSTT